MRRLLITFLNFFCLPQKANYFGSLTQASTTSLGIGPDGRDVYVPLKDLLPMLNPNDIEFDGIIIMQKKNLIVV